MSQKFRQLARVFAAVPLICGAAAATVIPRLSLEELIDHSEVIVTGRIARSRAAWDSRHKYIWTHHELTVGSVHKGSPARTVEFAEPGGIVDGIGMSISGSVVYHPGDQVLIFLERMPNGYLRTTGWGQGKYLVDSRDRVHADSPVRGLEVIDAGTRAGAAAANLDGAALSEAGQRISARVRLQRRTP